MPRILVITSCTGEKSVPVGEGPVAAQDLYTGEQHRRLMSGVAAYRAAREPAGQLDLRVVSAGYGVLRADDMVRGYNRTFKTMRRADAGEHASQLAIPAALCDALEEPMRFGLLLLGEDYLRACTLPRGLAVGGPVVAVVNAKGGRLLPGAITAAVTTEEDTRRFAAGYVGLKGEIGGRALMLLARDPAAADRLAGGDLSELSGLVTEANS